MTPLQIETLALIAKGSVYDVKFGYGAWRIQGASPNAVGRLVSLGMAKWLPSENDRRGCVLTDAGAAALRERGL